MYYKIDNVLCYYLAKYINLTIKNVRDDDNGKGSHKWIRFNW